MATEIGKKKDSKGKKITFQCKYCEKSKPLEEMVVLNRFSPQVLACRDCEKNMR